MKKKYLILLSFLLQCILISCTSQSTTIFQTSTENCVDSFDVFAYTIPDFLGPEQETFHPITPWQVETSLPEELHQGLIEVEASRYKDGNLEIWIKKSPFTTYFDSSITEPYSFMVYQSNTNAWKLVSANIENSDVYVDHLYVGTDGTIWGRNVWARDATISEQPILSRFNEETEQFTLQQSTQVIPHGHKSSDSSFPNWGEILLDSTGVFWIFVSQDAIYSYDHISQKVVRHVDLSEYSMVNNLTLAPDGSFYFMQRLPTEVLENEQILQFIPETGTIKPVKIPLETWLKPKNILVDHVGRLWLDAFGWRELDGKWVKLHPRMREFRKEFVQNDMWTVFYPPEIFMESSDGRMWFRIDKQNDKQNLRTGMAWINPNTNEGCWFTSESTNIIEDQQNNLWMIASGKLYKLDLDQ
jgi:hypothetical protein